ncbi:disease resistance protein RPV1-like [Mangifera indica]|uniref:disease resistance protein RPV1-like n=1 Tax=Mangifera indica TaxID=29780 RepID=UPI001CFA66BD|nr:disease resistance protein RPV1-like [Mangifera indica]
MASSSSASSSSSSSTTPKAKYKVFISFRGEDTRSSFTSHLYEELCKENIATFIDDKLIKGDRIPSSLSYAIKQSKIAVVIFSEQYASSRWCLQELERILECNEKYGQILIPVFYRIDPTDVRNQTGSFGEGFSELEERFKDDHGKLQRWRTALTAAANTSGFDSNIYRLESSLVKAIVKNILERLNDEYLEIDNRDLVGLDSRIEHIENLFLKDGVRKLGIWGIGGIGKTTLAGAVFRKICKQFETKCFIRNIREESEKSGGLNDLRHRVSSKVFGEKHSNIGFTLERKRLGRALIVFDDVTKLEQMECLMEHFDYLDSESLIIITARDEQVLKKCGVDPANIFKMDGLSGDEASELFNQYAFGDDSPTEDFIQLSSWVVAYAKGLPLALKILGSFLFKRTKQDWESALENLKKCPHMDICNVLKVSYEGLDHTQKQVFLDIACFFKGCERDLIEQLFDACGFTSHNCINVLIERSLITLSANIITMHDLLQEMGKQIVREESGNNFGERSRLWDPEEIYSVLKNNTGKGTVRSISLDMSRVKEIHLQSKAFNKMHELRFFEAYGFTRHSKVSGFEELKADFSELRYFCWYSYSDESLPQDFNPENLVGLYLTRSNLKRLWRGVKKLKNLKHIDLTSSENLQQMPNLSFCPNLESLILQGCKNLYDDFSWIRHLYKLVLLNLQECKGFESLPINPRWKVLRKLVLSRCSTLKIVPYIPDTVEELYLDGTAIEELPSLKHLSSLKILNLEKCSKLEHFPDSIGELEFLRILILSNCSKIKRVPCIPNRVEELYLDGTEIEELPPLEHLSALVKLSLKKCLSLKSLPESICEVKSLRCLYLSGSSKLDILPTGLQNLKALEELEFEGIGITDLPLLTLKCLNNLKKLSFTRFGIQEPPSFLLEQLPDCHRLEELNLEDCSIEVLPNNLGELRYLRVLYLGRNNIESLPESIKDLSNLYELNLSNCKRLKSLPKLPDKLLITEAKGCTSVEALSGLPNHCLSMVADKEEINFINCCNLRLDLTDVLPNIERNADVWFRSQVNTTWLSRDDQPMASICYPGSEIPDWFTLKSENGYIELPSDWLNDDLIGFAFCAVASFQDYEDPEALQIRCFLVVDEQIVSTGCLFNDYGQEVIDTDDVTELDHVFLGYDYNIMALELPTISSDNKGYVEFFVEHGSKKNEKKTKLKKCGVRLLYAKDKTAARVDRDQRFPIKNDCFRCYLHCCVKHDRMDEKLPYEILDSWSPYSEIYKPPIRRDYAIYIGCKVIAHLMIGKRTELDLTEFWRLKSSYRKVFAELLEIVRTR